MAHFGVQLLLADLFGAVGDNQPSQFTRANKIYLLPVCFEGYTNFATCFTFQDSLLNEYLGDLLYTYWITDQVLRLTGTRELNSVSIVTRHKVQHLDDIGDFDVRVETHFTPRNLCGLVQRQSHVKKGVHLNVGVKDELLRTVQLHA